MQWLRDDRGPPARVRLLDDVEPSIGDHPAVDEDSSSPRLVREALAGATTVTVWPRTSVETAFSAPHRPLTRPIDRSTDAPRGFERTETASGEVTRDRSRRWRSSRLYGSTLVLARVLVQTPRSTSAYSVRPLETGRVCLRKGGESHSPPFRHRRVRPIRVVVKSLTIRVGTETRCESS